MVSMIIFWSTNSIQALAIMFELRNYRFSRHYSYSLFSNLEFETKLGGERRH